MTNLLICQRCQVDFEAKRSDAKWCPSCRVLRGRERAAQYEGRQRDVCPDCGNAMVRNAMYCRSCSNKHRHDGEFSGKGIENPNWKGGRTIQNGYVLVRVQSSGPNPYRGEHIVVWEHSNGPLPKGDVIHHLNGNKQDNRIENLVALSRKAHATTHRDHGMYEARIRELEALIAGVSPRTKIRLEGNEDA